MMNTIIANVNPFDPNRMVEVVDVTMGVQPDVLHYNLRDKDKTVMTSEPDFERTGWPIYSVPRFYAERLLQNAGGRTFRLVFPNTLTIKMPNTRGGSDYVTVKAYHLCGDNVWRELTDEEIAEKENPTPEQVAEKEKPLRSRKKNPAPVLSEKIEPTLDDILGEDLGEQKIPEAEVVEE